MLTLWDTLWRNGEIEFLLREGRMIQRRLSKSNKYDPSKSNKNDPPNKARIFAKLVMEGQINSACDISVRMIVEEYYR